MLILAVKFWTVSTPSIFASSGPSPRRLNQWWIAATPWSGGPIGSVADTTFDQNSDEDSVLWAPQKFLWDCDWLCHCQLVWHCFVLLYPRFIMDLLERRYFFLGGVALHGMYHIVDMYIQYSHQYLSTISNPTLFAETCEPTRPAAEPLVTLGNQDAHSCGMTDVHSLSSVHGGGS